MITIVIIITRYVKEHIPTSDLRDPVYDPTLSNFLLQYSPLLAKTTNLQKQSVFIPPSPPPGKINFGTEKILWFREVLDRGCHFSAISRKNSRK